MQVGNLSPSGSSVLSSYINGYSGKINKSLERLASGLRVSKPSDSPGDYFKAQSLERRANEVNNIERGMQTHIARVQTADGYLDTASSLLNDMADLALEASNETDNDLRVNLGKEYDVKYQALKTFVESARFEGEALLNGTHDGSIGVSLSAQIDEGTGANYSYDILDTRIDESSGLNLGSENDAETAWVSQSGAQGYYDAITTEDKGLTRLNRNVNRVNTHVGILEGASSALSIKATNYEAAASSLISVDDAQESTRLSSMQIRQQAAASFLAQNNMVRANIYSTLSYSDFK